jgi:peptidoglycan hydrolase CwlO-like protein
MSKTSTDNPDVIAFRDKLNAEIARCENQIDGLKKKIEAEEAKIASKQEALAQLPKPTEAKPPQKTASASDSAD